MSIFEKATRQKLRFSAPGIGGSFTVEDLWDLPLQSKTGKASLDAIAVALFRVVQESAPVSFVDASASTGANNEAQLKFEVVKHIIDTKKAENARAAELAAARQQDQVILGAIADRERAELLALPLDQLRARLSSAGAAPVTASEEA